MFVATDWVFFQAKTWVFFKTKSTPRDDVVNLHFDEWFKPFNDERIIHPYLDEGQSDNSPMLS